MADHADITSAVRENRLAAQAAEALHEIMSSATHTSDRVFTLRRRPASQDAPSYPDAIQAIVRLWSTGAITKEQRDTLIEFVAEDHISDRVADIVQNRAEAV